MSLTITALIKNTRTITVRISNVTECLTVVYKPGEITQRMLKDARAGDGIGALINQLCSIVQSWDLVDDDGKPLPLTQDALESLPVWFLREVIDALVGDVAVMTTEEKKSSGGTS